MGVGISPGQNLLESSILGSLNSFNFFFFFCDRPIKLAHCNKKKVGVVRHPQLISMKQNKYPQLNGCSLQGVLLRQKMVTNSSL
jgi:hypothetical protein